MGRPFHVLVLLLAVSIAGCAARRPWRTRHRWSKRGRGIHDSRYESDDICSLRADPGTCPASLVRFYYNARSGRCDEFTYGGCKGNDNRFTTLDECEETCGSDIRRDSEDVCKLRRVSGDCGKHITRYYFNRRSGRCEKFTWRGCASNANNFRSLRECERKCDRYDVGREADEDTCEQRKEIGDCGKHITRYYFNSRTRRCEKFIWRGCVSNENNFRTLHECQRTCREGRRGTELSRRGDACSLSKDEGTCHKRLHRYYFNRRSGKCQKFVYGGCKGNQNNFKTRRDCERRCRKSRREGRDDEPSGICRLRREPGNCSGNLQAFYYDFDKRDCFAFKYTGCGGNGNNFVSANQCKKICMEPWD